MTATAENTGKLTPSSLGGLRVAAVRERPKTINMLVYGDSGVGKTQITGSADAVPEMRPILVIDVEGGTLTLAHTYPDAEVVRVQSWDDMQRLYNELYRGDHPYRTVVLDSLGEIQKFSMYQIMKDLVAREPSRDPDIPSMREWGKNIEQMRLFVRAFRDLPMNALFTCLAKQDKDPKTGTVKTLPQLPGKLANEVAAFLDIVTYMYVKNIKEGEAYVRKRFLLTGATETQVAKDRSGSLPLVLEEPTMRDIYDYAINRKANA
jgi:hypothetical protein